VVVVLGAFASEMRAALAGREVLLVKNERWPEGMSTSVKAGLEALCPEAAAALFVLGDQPGLRTSHINALLEAFAGTPADIVYPTFGGQRGNPVLFARRTFPALQELAGDQGGRVLITSGRFHALAVEMGNAGVLMDIDTPEDWARWQRQQEAGQTSLEKTMEHDMTEPLHPHPTAHLANVRGWLIDLDGVIYRGEQLLAGAPEFIATLREEGIPFLFLTNNSSRTPAQYAERLSRMGIPAGPMDFYTSSQATAEYLRREAEPGTAVFVIGMDGIRQALEEAGFRITQNPSEAAYCVVGYDNRITYHDLAQATRAVFAGARLIGTNPDPTLPVEDGFIPGAGAILAAVATAAGVTPLIIGKPEPTMLSLALERLGMPAQQAAIVGDRLNTDVAGGLRLGLFTVLVLTGSTRRQDAELSSIHPHLIVEDLEELLSLWKRYHILRNT
ncbi:MAG: HAD-IIA family hydrolase, partial [Anaerolineae bacterium]